MCVPVHLSVAVCVCACPLLCVCMYRTCITFAALGDICVGVFVLYTGVGFLFSYFAPKPTLPSPGWTRVIRLA